jgi:hypothetical protein
MTLCSATRGLDLLRSRNSMHYLAVSTPRMKCVLNLTNYATALHLVQPGRVALLPADERPDHLRH